MRTYLRRVLRPSTKRSSTVRFGALPGSITDQKLVFEQKRLRGDGGYATWAEHLREGDQQVDGEDEEFARGANRSMTASTRKTAPQRRIP